MNRRSCTGDQTTHEALSKPKIEREFGTCPPAAPDADYVVLPRWGASVADEWTARQLSRRADMSASARRRRQNTPPVEVEVLPSLDWFGLGAPLPLPEPVDVDAEEVKPSVLERIASALERIASALE